ncbi:MAG: 8-oxo-dGTP diphosphatase [Elusimicrobia bacterium]|nr:8-oxo-dGTP diphosphatase [Elusimicrobiota bacterium]
MTARRVGTVAATLCYVRAGGKTLMLHRNKKAGDIHLGKWNGLGGKLEPGESPEECVVREVREESGLVLLDPRLRGVLTFPAFKDGEDWLAFVYTATRFEGRLGECAEGALEWIDDGRIAELPLWEGDRIFLPWLDEERFFSGKFVYRNGLLVAHEASFY